MACNTVVIQSKGKAKVNVSTPRPVPVILSRATVARVIASRPQSRVLRQSTPVNVVERDTRVTVGGLGIKGAPGETEGATFVATAGETIHGLRAVRIDDDQIFHPDVGTPLHGPQTIGVVQQSGSIGAQLLVRTGGLLSDPTFNWSPGLVWCGAAGVLTQTPSNTGWLLQIGRVKNPTTIEVDVDVLIMRS